MLTDVVVTVADLLDEFGPIPASRLRQFPAAGSATVDDVVDIEEYENRLYELINGVLVEKTTDAYESYLAAMIIRHLGNYCAEKDIGVTHSSDGMIQLFPDEVRIPDASVIKWDQVPAGGLRAHPAPEISPNLAVKSSANRTRERKWNASSANTSRRTLSWFGTCILALKP